VLLHVILDSFYTSLVYAAPLIEASRVAISGRCSGPAAGAAPPCSGVGCEAGTGAAPAAGVPGAPGIIAISGAAGCSLGANALPITFSN